MTRLVTILLLVAVPFCLFAAPRNPMTATPGDPVYQSVRRLAILAGSTPPPAISPISYSELEAVLRRIDVERLPSREQDEYRSTLSLVAADATPVPGGTVGVDVTAEGYFHVSDAVDWRYWYPDRRSMLSIPFRVRAVPGLGISWDLDWRKNYPYYPGYEDVYTVVNPEPYSNIIGDVRETDVQFPFRALLTAAGEGWSIQAGRTRMGWGLGHTGSLLLSDHADYHDFVTASIFGKLAGYRALYLDLEPWLNGGGTDPERAYFAHRVELRPARWLSLAANEAMVFHGKNLELRYLSPLMIMHSFFIPNYANTMITLEMSARPIGGLELWAHMAIDQIQSAIEKERGYADDEPQAFGYLAGAEYVLPASGWWFTFGTEWAYLNPWMYIGRDIMGSFSYRRRVQAENVLPAGAKVIVEKSLGYPAGPDYYGISAYANADCDRYSLALDASFYAKGENDVGRSLPPVDDVDAARTTPSGSAPEFVAAARLTADASVFRLAIRNVPVEVEAGFVLDVVRVFNNDNIADALVWDLQFSPYVSLSTVFGK